MSWKQSVLGVLSNCITLMASLTVHRDDERRLRNGIADLQALEAEFETIGVVIPTEAGSDEVDLNPDVMEDLLSMSTALSSRRLFGDHAFVKPIFGLSSQESGLIVPVTAAEPGRAIERATRFASDVSTGELPMATFKHRCESCSAMATTLMDHLDYGPIHVVGHSTAECARNPLLSKRTGEALLAIESLREHVDLRPVYLDAELLEDEE